MKSIVILLALVLPLTSMDRKDESSDLKKIQGDWVGVDDEAKLRVSFEKDKIDMRSEKTGEWYNATFALNSTSQPKEISVTITDSPVKELNGLTSLGIYRLSKDRLTITACRPGEPEGPKEFDAPDCRTVELKRP